MSQFINHGFKLVKVSKSALLSLLLLTPLLLGLFSLSPAGSPKAYAANNATSVCQKLIAGGSVDPSKVPNNHPRMADCKEGYNAGYNNPNQNKTTPPEGPCDPSQPSFGICDAAYKQGQKDKKAEKPQPTAAAIKTAAEKACAPYKTQSGVSDANRTKNFDACVDGYTNQKAGDDQTEACKTFSGPAQSACIEGFDNAVSGAAVKPGTGGGGATPTPTTGTTNTSAAGDEKQLDCDKQFDNPLTWLICPVVDMLAGIVDGIDNLITDQMSIETDEIFCQTGAQEKVAKCTAYYTAWQSFRNIALGLMVIAGLIILISQALGMEILDAYTIKKTLPRVLIAALAITISWPLMKFAVEFTNDLGFGIRRMIYLPFANLGNDLDLSFGGSITNALFGSGALVAGAAAAPVAWFVGLGGIGGLLAYLGSAALAVFIAIMVLILRQVAIIMLMLMAPIAIVAYILPNTAKIYKFWWESFSKALLMFPLIAAFIATGRVFSAVSISNGGALNQFIAFIAYFAPYFLIPLTFKFAGGALRQIGGFVNDRGKGSFDRLRNFREGRRKGGFQRIQQGNIFRGAPMDSKRSKINSAYQAASLANPDEIGYNPRKWKSRAQALQERANQHNSGEILQAAEFAPALGDDDFSRAAEQSGGSIEGFKRHLRATEKFTEPQIEQKATLYAMLRNKYGDSSLNQALLQSRLMASTSFEPSAIGEVLDEIDRVSGGNVQTKAQLIGKVKELAPKAGRPDLAAPFSNMFDQVEAISRSTTPEARQAAIEHANEYLADVNTEVEGAAYWFTGKGAATEAGMASIQRKVQRAANNVVAAAQNGGQPITVTRLDGKQVQMTEAEANREMKQTLAYVAATQDLSPNLSQEKLHLLVDGVLSQNIPGFKTTVLENVDDLSTDPEFTEARGRYERSIVQSREQAEAQATQASTQAAAAEQARQVRAAEIVANMSDVDRAKHEARVRKEEQEAVLYPRRQQGQSGAGGSNAADQLLAAQEAARQAAEAQKQLGGQGNPLDPNIH